MEALLVNAHERPFCIVSDTPRTFDEGKKIGLSDGVRALFIVVRERFRRGSR